MLNLAIGSTTPTGRGGPLRRLYRGETTMERLSRAMLTLWPAMVFILLLTTYVPWLTTFLPDLIMP